MTTPAAAQREVALEIHLPKFIGRCALEAHVRAVLLCLRRIDQATPAQDRSDVEGAGNSATPRGARKMYVQGVSTRKIKTITEELCGHDFSASAISHINVKLDGELERFARRPL